MTLPPLGFARQYLVSERLNGTVLSCGHVRLAVTELLSRRALERPSETLVAWAREVKAQAATV
jgi:hypothetical protein